MRHEVGQIIYLLSNNEMKIFPARVEEEIIRRRVGAESTTYRVSLPNKSRDVVDLADLDVTVFVTPADLRSHMVENAIKTIDSLVERSIKFSKAFEDARQEPEHVREDE